MQMMFLEAALYQFEDVMVALSSKLSYTKIKISIVFDALLCISIPADINPRDSPSPKLTNSDRGKGKELL